MLCSTEVIKIDNAITALGNPQIKLPLPFPHQSQIKVLEV